MQLMQSLITLKINGVGSVAEVAVAALLYSHVIFLCSQVRSESEEMVKVQRHRLLHLHLQLGVCNQRMRGLWVYFVVVLVPGLTPDVGVVAPAKPWFDATMAVELSNVWPCPSLPPLIIRPLKKRTNMKIDILLQVPSECSLSNLSRFRGYHHPESSHSYPYHCRQWNQRDPDFDQMHTNG